MRIGSIDPVHIGIDLAFVRLERCRQRNTGGVRAAAPQGSDIALLIHTLEARHDDHLAGSQISANALIIDMLNACLVESTVGHDPDLRARVGNSRHIDGLERHRQKAYGDLLARRNDHIQLTRVRFGLHLARQCDQPIGFPAHGRNHHNQIIASLTEALDLLRYLANALNAADRGTAKLLDNECHFLAPTPNTDTG